jgi:hypothetical protein
LVCCPNMFFVAEDSSYLTNWSLADIVLLENMTPTNRTRLSVKGTHQHLEEIFLERETGQRLTL